MKAAIAGGRIPMGRIDDAVRRILRAKSAAGLGDAGRGSPPLSVVGSPDHRSLAAEAVRRSAVLLKNDGALPLPAGAESIGVAGIAADDIGLQCGGWTVGWMGGAGPITTGTTLLDGLQGALGSAVAYRSDGDFSARTVIDVGILCIAEPPYAEGPGDRAAPTPSDDDRVLFSRMRARVDKLVLVVYSGRPLVMPELIAKADAVVAAWLPGSEGAALADVLLGRHPFEGRTPQPWPRTIADLGDPAARPLLPMGHGLTAGSQASRTR